MCEELGIMEGQTTKDDKFSVEKVACVVACHSGPIVAVDNYFYGDVNGTGV